ncbi:hypothetical protein [Aeromicrobium duanguangcaii]|uniref:hypothetical protein n=1 Tax=Aeromicrobium duanguangcaii TaxID=2968086 RepID=UPI0020180FF4|nr:hypothetical protein [Aeromicrobium duanguangcaii]MCL3837044.1 hypothetical protein [Aeromicrobium duanguangcaii]
MARHRLSVRFVPDWSARGGQWVTPPPFVVSVWRQLQDGNECKGLPRGCEVVGPELDAALDLLGDAYRAARTLEPDVTVGWRDELSLRRRLGGDWDVVVNRSPGVNEVRLMGEYGCDWPLWTDGGTDRDDWPMLSDALADRLRAWAVDAEPDHRVNHLPGPEPEVTQGLLRDLRRELGDRYRIVAVL